MLSAAQIVQNALLVHRLRELGGMFRSTKRLDVSTVSESDAMRMDSLTTVLSTSENVTERENSAPLSRNAAEDSVRHLQSTSWQAHILLSTSSLAHTSSIAAPWKSIVPSSRLRRKARLSRRILNVSCDDRDTLLIIDNRQSYGSK